MLFGEEDGKSSDEYDGAWGAESAGCVWPAAGCDWEIGRFRIGRNPERKKAEKAFYGLAFVGAVTKGSLYIL